MPNASSPKFKAETVRVTRTDVLQQSLKKGTANHILGKNSVLDGTCHKINSYVMNEPA